MRALSTLDPREAFPAFLDMTEEDFDLLHGDKPTFEEKRTAEPEPELKPRPFRRSRRRDVLPPESKLMPEAGSYTVYCPFCEARAFDGEPAHLTGCPNMVEDWKFDDTVRACFPATMIFSDLPVRIKDRSGVCRTCKNAVHKDLLVEGGCPECR